MKLQSKIIALLLPLTLLPIFILGVIAYQQINKNFIANSHEKTDKAIDQIENLFNLKIDTAISNIKLFSSSRLLEKYVTTDDEESRYLLLQGPLLRLFSSFQKSYSEYYEIRVIFPDGYEDIRQTSYNIKNVTEFEQDTSFIKNMMSYKDDIYFDIERNPDNDKISLYVSKRLFFKNRASDTLSAPAKLRGYLVITIDLISIQTLLNNNRIGQSGILVLTDDQGNIIFQPEKHSANNIYQTVSQGKRDLTKIDGSLFKHFVKSAENNETLTFSFDNVSSYIHGQNISKNLYLLAYLPDNELVEQQTRLGNIVLLIMLLATAFTAGLIFAALKYFILNPLHQLEAIAKSIGHGHLDNEINITSHDEMGSLAASLQQMSNNLQTTNERIRYIAYHDALTGLPNRLMFREYLGRAIASTMRSGGKLALLFLDLDNFKWVNDTLGHDSGDELLKEISDRLEQTLRGTDYIAHGADQADDVVARLGGDEFIILLSDVGDSFVPGHISARILESLSEKIKINNQEIFAGVSIGITVCPDDSNDADELIKNADIAMYHAKKQGKNNYQYFSSSLNDAVSYRLSIENRLRKAIENNQLTLAYQPQIKTDTHEITSVEALLRWHDEEYGNISPAEFIPVAEDSGLILPLGEWVINQACAQLKAWRDSGLPEITVAVNVSSVQFSRQELPEIINNALKKYSVSPGLLEIELTESIFLHNEQHASDMLFSIRTMGVEVSLDDFGTGYSSLAYLRKFPIDNLKIDRSFINEISHSPEGEEIITAIIRMAHAMKLKVIAEGVETNEQLRFLKQQQCDFVQGFYFYKALPAEEVSTLLYSQVIESEIKSK